MRKHQTAFSLVKNYLMSGKGFSGSGGNRLSKVERESEPVKPLCLPPPFGQNLRCVIENNGRQAAISSPENRVSEDSWQHVSVVERFRIVIGQKHSGSVALSENESPIAHQKLLPYPVPT